MKREDLLLRARYKYNNTEEDGVFYFKILENINGSIITLAISRDMTWAQSYIFSEKDIEEFLEHLEWPSESEQDSLMQMEKDLQHDWGNAFRIKES